MGLSGRLKEGVDRTRSRTCGEAVAGVVEGRGKLREEGQFYGYIQINDPGGDVLKNKDCGKGEDLRGKDLEKTLRRGHGVRPPPINLCILQKT